MTGILKQWVKEGEMRKMRIFNGINFILSKSVYLTLFINISYLTCLYKQMNKKNVGESGEIIFHTKNRWSYYNKSRRERQCLKEVRLKIIYKIFKIKRILKKPPSIGIRWIKLNTYFGLWILWPSYLYLMSYVLLGIFFDSWHQIVICKF